MDNSYNKRKTTCKAKGDISSHHRVKAEDIHSHRNGGLHRGKAKNSRSHHDIHDAHGAEDSRSHRNNSSHRGKAKDSRSHRDAHGDVGSHSHRDARGVGSRSYRDAHVSTRFHPRGKEKGQIGSGSHRGSIGSHRGSNLGKNAPVNKDYSNKSAQDDQDSKEVVFDGTVVVENGIQKKKAKIRINNDNATITLSFTEPFFITAGPGYDIVLEGPKPWK